MGEFSFAVDLPVRNEWANVDLVRTSLQNCLSAMFCDVDGCHAIAMVTGELLENAVKYGYWEGTERTFRLRVCGAEGAAHISVESPVAGGDPNVAELLQTIAWIRGCASAEEAYRARLLQIGGGSGVSKLGLVRIAYEGGCALTAEVSGDTLRVSAELVMETQGRRR